MGTRDHSEVSLMLQVQVESFLTPIVRRALRQALSTRRGRNSVAIVPTMFSRLLPSDDAIPPLTIPDPRAVQLEVRTGTRPEDRVYYSAGPFTTERHLAFLSHIEGPSTVNRS